MAKSPAIRNTADKPRSTPTTTHSPDTQRGIGDELQQQAGGEHPVMTTQQGIPIADNQNSLRDTPRGPPLLEDFILREKITHFDHERIPERIVHARGSATHGYFECTKAIPEFTRAFVTERDYIMAEVIKRETEAKHVVAVVGLAHVSGVATILQRSQFQDREIS